jgi:hypothetical protein
MVVYVSAYIIHPEMETAWKIYGDRFTLQTANEEKKRLYVCVCVSPVKKSNRICM